MINSLNKSSKNKSSNKSPSIQNYPKTSISILEIKIPYNQDTRNSNLKSRPLVRAFTASMIPRFSSK